jgi:hypothetical protein
MSTSMPPEPGTTVPPEDLVPADAAIPSGSWASYRDRMITGGQMTAAVRWAGLATPLDRIPGVFVVADRVRGDERVLDVGYAHDLRAHFADAHRIAGWRDRTIGQILIYTIPNSTVLDHHLALGQSPSHTPERFTDE